MNLFTGRIRNVTEMTNLESPTSDTFLLHDHVPWYYTKYAIVVSTSMALFLDMLSYSIIIPIIPLYVHDKLHLSPSFLGALFGAYALGLLLATPY